MDTPRRAHYSSNRVGHIEGPLLTNPLMELTEVNKYGISSYSFTKPHTWEWEINWLLCQDPLLIQTALKLLFLELPGPHLISVGKFSEEVWEPPPQSTHSTGSILSKNLVTKTMRYEFNK